MPKLKILLYWFEMDQRPELLQPFVELSAHFEFIHIIYRKPAERTTSSSPFKMIYWFDYSSPYQLLNKIKPDRVVITDAADLLSISLVIACKSRNIATFSLQHGFVIGNVVSNLADIVREPILSKNKFAVYAKLLAFYIKGINYKKLFLLPQLISFLFSYYKHGGTKSLYRNKYNWRLVDNYLCYSEGSAKVFFERDGIDNSKVKIIGVITFDELFKVLNNKFIQPSGDKYYLLIDTNFSEHKNPVTNEQILRNYQELAEYCKNNNARLKVKLHPWCYNKDYTKEFRLDNVDFLKNIPQYDLAVLIKNAIGCFGFFSTLSFPVLA